MAPLRLIATLMLLQLSAPAFAAPVDRVEKLIELGRPEQAISMAQKFLIKSPGDSALQDALQRAYFSYAQMQNTIDSYRGFRERYPKGPLADEAFKRMAKMEWDLLAGSKVRDEVARYRMRYPNGPFDEQARHLESNLAFRDAQHANTIESWSDFVANFPKDPRVNTATERIELAALNQARSVGTRGALLGFLSAYPNSTRAGAVLRDALIMGTNFANPCPGDPPECAQLEANTTLLATWEPVNDAKIKAELVAWSKENGPAPLEPVLLTWAGDVYADQVAELAEKMQGTVTDNQWEMSLPFVLKKPGAVFDGYGLKLEAKDAAPAIFSFNITEVWPTPRAAKTNVYQEEKALFVESEGKPRQMLVTSDDIPLNDPKKSARFGRFFYAWGKKGLVQIDLDTGEMDRFVQGREVTHVWNAEETFLFETRGDGDSATLKKVDTTGKHVVIMPPPHRANAPTEFWTLAVAQKAPVAILYLKGRGYAWAPADAEPRPLKTPESVPTEDRNANPIVLNPQGTKAAFFVGGKNPQVVVITLDKARALEVPLDARGLFGRSSVTWSRVSWTDDFGLLGEVATTDKVVMLVGSTVSVLPSEILEEAHPSPLRPPDAEEGTEAFVYEPSLYSFLR